MSEKTPVSDNSYGIQLRIENIQPILNVKNMNSSRAFYVDILGFKEADWGTEYFTAITRDHSGLYLCKGAQGNPGTWIWVGFDGDIFKLHEQLKARGVTIRQPPLNFSWALEMHVEDPDGHVLRFGTDPNQDEPFIDQSDQSGNAK